MDGSGPAPPGADPSWMSVDRMIVAASTTPLADSRSGGRGGFLPWALLAVGSAASLAANVAVAEPTATGRVIAAWPSFALIASYELLMRQVRRAARRPARPGSDPARPATGQDTHQRLADPLFDLLTPGDGSPGAAGKLSSWRGSGRWPTGRGTVRCPPAGTSGCADAVRDDLTPGSSHKRTVPTNTVTPARRDHRRGHHRIMPPPVPGSAPRPRPPPTRSPALILGRVSKYAACHGAK
jgi:hypothetical protein